MKSLTGGEQGKKWKFSDSFYGNFSVGRRPSMDTAWGSRYAAVRMRGIDLTWSSDPPWAQPWAKGMLAVQCTHSLLYAFTDASDQLHLRELGRVGHRALFWFLTCLKPLFPVV